MIWWTKAAFWVLYSLAGCDHCVTMFLFLAHAFHRLCTKRSYRHGTKRHMAMHPSFAHPHCLRQYGFVVGFHDASKCVARRNDPQPQFNSDQVHHGRCSDVCLSDQIVISLSPAPHPHFDPSCVCDLPFPLLRTSPFLPIPMHHLSICVFHRFSVSCQNGKPARFITCKSS